MFYEDGGVLVGYVVSLVELLGVVCSCVFVVCCYMCFLGVCFGLVWLLLVGVVWTVLFPGVYWFVM